MNINKTNKKKRRRRRIKKIINDLVFGIYKNFLKITKEMQK